MPRSIRVNITARMDVSESVSEKNDRTKSVHTSDGAFGFQVEARGTVKVGGSTHAYPVATQANARVGAANDAPDQRVGFLSRVLTHRQIGREPFCYSSVNPAVKARERNTGCEQAAHALPASPLPIVFTPRKSSPKVAGPTATDGEMPIP